MGLLLHCKIKLAYALGRNLVKWRTELVKITFQWKKKYLSCCTETFLPGNWDDGKTASWEGGKRMKAIQF